MRYILAYDLGTGGLKAALYSDQGKYLDSLFAEYPTVSARETWAEQSPAAWWSAFCTTSRALIEKHGLEVLVPPAEDRRVVHDVIYNELCRGQIRDESRQRFRQLIRRLADEGAAGVILGCTEIGLLIKQADSPVPLFDTAVIHAEAAADFALQPA